MKWWCALTLTLGVLLGGCTSRSNVIRSASGLPALIGEEVVLIGDFSDSKIPSIRIDEDTLVDVIPKLTSPCSLDDARGKSARVTGRLERFVATYTAEDLERLRSVAGRWPLEPGTYEEWTIRDADICLLDAPSGSTERVESP